MSSSNFKNEPDEGVFGPVEKNRTLPEVLPAFSLLIRDVARSRFAYISKMKDVVIEENKNWDDFSYGSSMSVILIAGKDFKLFFKAHFHQKKYQRASGGEMTADSAQDVFREYTNLTAGAIKRALTELDIVCGISLPNITSGYDELIFSDTLRRARIVECFDVVSPNFKFTITAALDIGDGEVLKALGDVVMKERNDDIEFL